MGSTKRFAVVGVGLWGSMHARIFSKAPGAELVALCDANPERLGEAAESFGVAKRFTDYRDLFDWGQLDAVSVATPDSSHRDVVLAALDRGLHVLVEKPLDVTVEGAEAIRNAAVRAGTCVMVDFHNRWNPAFVAARQGIDNGEIGRPLSACFRLSNTRLVATRMLSWAAQSNVLWFLGSHAVDLLLWLFGSRPQRVYAVSRSGVLKSLGVDTPDFFHATIEFEGGGVASLQHVWILPETEPSVVDLKCSLIGSEGSIYIDTTHHRALQKYTREGAGFGDVLAAFDVHGRPAGFAVESLRHFVDCVVDGRPPLVGVEEGLAVTRTICAMLMSAAKAEPIELSE